MDRFYDTAATVVFDHDGMVDKFVGDELVALFFPLLTGERHAARAVDAARALLRATGHADPGGPWVPIGAGVHTGMAWVGAVGAGTHTALTALGDTVNTTLDWHRPPRPAKSSSPPTPRRPPVSTRTSSGDRWS